MGRPIIDGGRGTGPELTVPHAPEPKATPRRLGVFVTGTDTGVGKTVVSACLVRAWQADYWKPAQTGLADDEGDTATVARLAVAPPERLHRPAWSLQAALSPEAAAAAEGASLALDEINLPATSRPLVVEGAGGVLVPLSADTLMVDLIVRLAFPVVVVARTTLGTINHTLLSLEALRARGLVVAGVILNGPADAGNRAAIAAHGRVRILAELPRLAPCADEGLIAALAQQIPPLATVCACASA